MPPFRLIVLARHVAIGCEHDRHVSDLVDAAEPTDRDARRVSRSGLAEHLGLDLSHGDRVEGDALGRELGGVAVGQPDQPCLRRCVVRPDRPAGLSGGRCDVDDPPPPSLAHRGEDGFRHEERRGQVDRDRLVPQVEVELVDVEHPLSDARVVHQDRRRSDLGGTSTDEALHAGGIADVSSHGDRPSAEADHLGCCRLGIGLPFPIVDDHVGPGGGEPDRDRSPHPPRRAGHDRHPIGQWLLGLGVGARRVVGGHDATADRTAGSTSVPSSSMHSSASAGSEPGHATRIARWVMPKSRCWATSWSVTSSGFPITKRSRARSRKPSSSSASAADSAASPALPSGPTRRRRRTW